MFSLKKISERIIAMTDETGSAMKRTALGSDQNEREDGCVASVQQPKKPRKGSCCHCREYPAGTKALPPICQICNLP